MGFIPPSEPLHHHQENKLDNEVTRK